VPTANLGHELRTLYEHYQLDSRLNLYPDDHWGDRGGSEFCKFVNNSCFAEIMKVAPFADRILVKPLHEDKTTHAGIIVPDTAKEKPEKGEVVATGPGKVNDNGQLLPMRVKVGNKVLFKKYSPDEVEVDGQELLVLKEEDILAVLE